MELKLCDSGERLESVRELYCAAFPSEERKPFSLILEKAAEYGIRPKIHANELKVSGGVQVGVRYDALSVDHLEMTTDAEIEHFSAISALISSKIFTISSFESTLSKTTKRSFSI